MKALERLVGSVGRRLGGTAPGDPLDLGASSGAEPPDSSLFQCTECGTVYIATDKDECSSCGTGTDRVPSTLSD
jgi:ribosomal protein L37E